MDLGDVEVVDLGKGEDMVEERQVGGRIEKLMELDATST